jgi:hypothetical protein
MCCTGCQIGIVLPTLNTIAEKEEKEKTPKCIMHNVTGSVVKGRS